ncbi:MAG: 1-deoxy-D-xylulose-5-phosphate reductoisomerase [Patescibacteria group bacterium]|nr:1-deoxy-D-xylulose-5-phosphate reductoisomerase [Patescibacteria group bacterium]
MEKVKTRRRKITILGSTGSVGTQTLEVIKKFPDLFSIRALAANTNVASILKQAQEYNPAKIAMMDRKSAAHLRKELKLAGGSLAKIKVLEGIDGFAELASEEKVDLVFNAVVGSIGIIPTLEAIKSQKTVALANKETLVAAGSIVNKALRENPKASLFPVDSEHSAIFQCLMGEKKESIQKIVLTCSGGPFLNTSLKKLKKATVKEAVAHPNWSMGGKISIDSSTLMNKGLEVIEAHWLFKIPYKKIEVLIHPQSLAHSMVAFKDGALKVQIGEATMKTPIQLALTYPQRLKNPDLKELDLNLLNTMEFSPPDLNKFPCLRHAYDAGEEGGTAPAVLNAANEAAVELFMRGKIGYFGIEQLVQKELEKHRTVRKPTLEDILAVDKEVKSRLLVSNK